MNIDNNLPVYPIGVAANLLNVHPRTLRIYEKEGLIDPLRKSGKRFFSKNDLMWIECIRDLIHEKNYSIPGIKKLLELVPCWKIKCCSEEVKKKCSVLKKKNNQCWEFAQRSCERSCKNCDIYKKRKKK